MTEIVGELASWVASTLGARPESQRDVYIEIAYGPVAISFHSFGFEGLRDDFDPAVREHHWALAEFGWEGQSYFLEESRLGHDFDDDDFEPVLEMLVEAAHTDVVAKQLAIRPTTLVLGWHDLTPVVIQRALPAT